MTLQEGVFFFFFFFCGCGFVYVCMCVCMYACVCVLAVGTGHPDCTTIPVFFFFFHAGVGVCMICVWGVWGCVCVWMISFCRNWAPKSPYYSIFLAVCSGGVLFIIKTRQDNENLRPTTIYKSIVVESYLYKKHANENLRPTTIYN